MNTYKDLGYVIHQRAYRETSAIIECFLKEHGRKSFICKGLKTNKRFNMSHILPFQKIVIHWQKQDKSLTPIKNIEVVNPVWLTGVRLKCGFYLNQLMYYMYKTPESSHALFERFGLTINALEKEKDIEPFLREFEYLLFEVLGYAIPFLSKFEDHLEYQFDFENGFYPSNGQYGYKGSSLNQIQNKNYNSKKTRLDAKLLSRKVIDILKKQIKMERLS